MKTTKYRYVVILFVIGSLVAIIPPSRVGAQEAPILFPVGDIDSITLKLETDPPPPIRKVPGDLADVYFPKVSAADNAFPIVAVLQGAFVDKKFYSAFGTQLSRFGFVVVIPNHLINFGPPGTPPVTPFPDEFVIWDVLAQMKAEDEKAEDEDGEPNLLFGIVDTTRMGLAGHSAGGAPGLFAIDMSCQPPFCFGPPGFPFPLPDAVRGGHSMARIPAVPAATPRTPPSPALTRTRLHRMNSA
jgi:hypothetical protein